MSSLPRVILMACGSFSPPTPMHFRMFEIARDHFQDACTHEVIGGIISPVHDSYGKKGLVPVKHRCAMVKLAIQSSDWIRLSDWECTQDAWTRTRMTLQHHQNFINNYLSGINGTINEKLPGWLPDGINNRKDKVQIKLLCGADLLESFSVPGLWLEEDLEEIIGNHGIVVISRNGSNPEKFIFESDLLTKYKTNITIVTNWVPNEVSSTMIRRLLSRGQSVKYLIDDLIIEYVKKNQLFNSNGTKYILTPNHNQLVINRNFLNDQYQANEINFSVPDEPSAVTDIPPKEEDGEIEQMDETDFPERNKKTLLNINMENSRPKVFCCGTETSNGFQNLLNRPGQAVKVITNSPGIRHTAADCIDGESLQVGNPTIPAFATSTDHFNDFSQTEFRPKNKLSDVDRIVFQNQSEHYRTIKKNIIENRLKSSEMPYH